MFFEKSSKEKVKGRIAKIDPMKRMWFFGIIIMVFSLFAEPKLVPAIILFILFMGYSQYKAQRRNTINGLKELGENEKELKKEEEIVERHIEDGNATLEEKLYLGEVKEALVELEEERLQLTQKIEEMDGKEKKIKNLLVKWKKPSKMLTTGEKEKEKEKKENI